MQQGKARPMDQILKVLSYTSAVKGFPFDCSRNS